MHSIMVRLKYLIPIAVFVSAVALLCAMPQSVSAKKGRRKSAQCPTPLTNKSSKLQKLLVKAVNAKGWGRYIKKKQLAISVVDLSKKGRIFYAGINDDHMMYAASMPKIAILLTVIQAVNDGKLQWTHEFDKRLLQMIVASSNADASWGTDLVGLLEIERTMRDPRYCFYDDKVGGLWVGRAYRSGGATNRDPLFNISHGSTSRQAARFYTMLQQGKLVSPHWSFRMLGLMNPPKHHHKFVGGLRGEKGVVFLARKSGTWRTFHADSALIEHGGKRYVIIGQADTRHGETIMRELAKLVDTIIMDGAHRRGRRRGTKNGPAVSKSN